MDSNIYMVEPDPTRGLLSSQEVQHCGECGAVLTDKEDLDELCTRCLRLMGLHLEEEGIVDG